MKTRLGHRRIAFVGVGFAAYFLLASGWVASLSYFKADRYVAAAKSQRNLVVALPSERGRIVDSNGFSLALSVESVAIDADPLVVESSSANLRALAKALDRTPQWIENRLAKARVIALRNQRQREVPVGEGDAAPPPKESASRTYAPLRHDASRSQAEAVVALQIKGVISTPTRTRLYPRGALAGQLLGYASVEGVGLAGIEEAFNSELEASRPTVRVRRGGRHQYGYVYPADRDYTRPSQGATVQLTIDAPLQRIVEDELVAAVDGRGAQSGVAIVMDVTTGAVLAMANAPLFDPNDKSQWTGPAPRNAAVFSRFEPGSTLKTFLAAGAIDAGVVWPEKEIFCENGRFRIGRYTISDHKPYGWLPFADVIRYSSNIGVAKVAFELGAERLGSTLRGFGFGVPTGIGLSNEPAGYVPPAGNWPLTTLSTASYGYGVTVTPLQLVRAYAALANGGRLIRPYVVSRVVDTDGRLLHVNEPEVVGIATSEKSSAVVNDMLVAAVSQGTGKAAQVQGVVVGGKTGTSRKVDPETRRYSRRNYLASFVGYFPAHRPQYVILVMIDQPQQEYYGGAVAAPVFRSISDFLVDRAGMRSAPAPVRPLVEQRESLQLASWQEQAAIEMPSYVGMSLREVLTQAARAGWELEVDGSGFVVWQDPAPGSVAGASRTLRLRLDAAHG